MEIEEINVSKLEECGNDLLLIQKENKIIIDELFDFISKLSEKKAWVGQENSSVEKYIEKCLEEKQEYINYSEFLKKIGYFLKDYAKKTEEIFKKMGE